MAILQNDWQNIIGAEFTKQYYVELRAFLKKEYATETIYPPAKDIFNALHYTSYAATNVVILGQDPYHGANQAHGLSFSVQKGIKLPPSLRNMMKELQEDLGCPLPEHGTLTSWAEQGVLLLNTVLTVRAGAAASHKGKGWELFTDAIISALNNRARPVIFVLWGKHAQAKKVLITNEQHYVIEAAHPSPFSAYRGFFGSKPFSQVNRILEREKQRQIDWCLPT